LNEIWDVYRASQFNEILKLKPQDSPGHILALTFLISELDELINRNEKLLKGFKKDASKKKERVRKVLKVAYYLKGIFSYQQNNHIAAVRSLEQALRYDKKFDEGEQLLRYIWESHCRPAWWRWWFFAPKPLKRWWKRAVASVLVLFTLLTVFCHFISTFLPRQS
jgi:tetratricopeptide (TPR) repeat protein